MRAYSSKRQKWDYLLLFRAKFDLETHGIHHSVQTRFHTPGHGYQSSTCVFSRDETDKEVNVKARLPAWAKGKSVILDMTQTDIRLSLKGEEATPIIEVLRIKYHHA